MKHLRRRAANSVWIGLATVGFVLGGWQGAAAQDQKPDVTEILRETVQASNEAGGLISVLWLPEEFWKATMAANPSLTPAQLEMFLKAVHSYFIVGVSSGKVGPDGAITYRTEAEVRGLVQLKDNEGSIYKPLPEDKPDPIVRACLILMAPSMAKTAGAFGENFHFYVFPGSRNDGTRICDPLKEGACEVDLGERAFKWRLPLGSLLPKQKCPVCGETLSGAHKFCPYDGAKLVGRENLLWVSSAEYVPPKPASLAGAATIALVENWPEPKTPEAFLRRGNEYARLRNYALAIQDASAALALKPDWVPALRLRAHAAYELKDYESAVRNYTTVLRQYPDWPQVYDQRGLAYSYSGRHDLGSPDCTQAIKLDPYVATPYNNRGWAYLVTGDVQRAIQDLDHAIELSPEFTRAHENRAKASDKQNDLQSELVDLEDVIRLAPGNQWAKDQREEVVRRLGSNGTKSVEGTPGEPPVAGIAGRTPQEPGSRQDLEPGPGVYSVGGGVSAPVPLYKPDPPYTAQAKKAKLSGAVLLLIVIDATGNVEDAKEVSPRLGDGLDENAVETIHTWKFKPAMREGVPVPVRMMVRVMFKLL
jgi:TonB family protein